MELGFLVIFFFSSRSRHTSSKRDWSSDVCSSDLTERPASQFLHESEAQEFRARLGEGGPRVHAPGAALRVGSRVTARGVLDGLVWRDEHRRSEERRVGEEGRPGGGGGAGEVTGVT